jgi:predicted O-methyltransferase YrrM
MHGRAVCLAAVAVAALQMTSAALVRVDVEAQDAERSAPEEWVVQPNEHDVSAAVQRGPSADPGQPWFAGAPGSLQALGRETGTDKCLLHGFCAWYERSFAAEMRDRPVRMLELGTLHGSSAVMWTRWFRNPRTTVIAVDHMLYPQARERFEALAAARANGSDTSVASLGFEIANLNDDSEIQRIAAAFGPFDIILDDASHSMQQQQRLLRLLLPALKPHGEGVYILEDLHSSFRARTPLQWLMRTQDDYSQHSTTIQLLYHLLNPAEEPFLAKFLSPDDVAFLLRDVASLDIFSRRHAVGTHNPAIWDQHTPLRSTTAILTRR